MTVVAVPLIFIDDVEHMADYRLRVFFSDDSVREIDFAPFLRQSTHPEIRKYLDIKKFKGFHLLNGDLMWGDYELLFPIHKLYDGKI